MYVYILSAYFKNRTNYVIGCFDTLKAAKNWRDFIFKSEGDDDLECMSIGRFKLVGNPIKLKPEKKKPRAKVKTKKIKIISKKIKSK